MHHQTTGILRYQKFLNALSSRLARNIYLWIFLIYLVLKTNNSNELAHHYGIIQSPWYPRIIIMGLLIQMSLVYFNNFLLIPRLLARRKYLHYFGALFVFLFIISAVYTMGLKIARPYFNIDHLQQMGFVTAPVTSEWRLQPILLETQTYFFGNMFWILLFTMAWYMNDYSRQRKMAEEARKQQTEAELSFLKSQLNPHFLFNTLNNLYALSLKQSQDAPDAILKLSSILRYLLYEANQNKISFDKEKEMMMAYIDLELLRLKNKDPLRFTITADTPCMVPPLLWLPVLENVFKHGTRIISAVSFVDYKYIISGNTLRISSVNNYKPGIAPENGGIGLENLQKRLSILYPGRYQLTSHSHENEYITDVIIELSSS